MRKKLKLTPEQRKEAVKRREARLAFEAKQRAEGAEVRAKNLAAWRKERQEERRKEKEAWAKEYAEYVAKASERQQAKKEAKRKAQDELAAEKIKAFKKKHNVPDNVSVTYEVRNKKEYFKVHQEAKAEGNEAGGVLLQEEEKNAGNSSENAQEKLSDGEQGKSDSGGGLEKVQSMV